MHDLVIRGGTILDGSGAKPYQADLGVKGDRIEEIDVGITDGVEELDANGMFVSPGFIDIHSHSDYSLLVDPRAVSAVYQGVTLEVIGNCGHGCFPVSTPSAAINAIYGYSDSVPLTWRRASEYFSRLEEAGPSVNVLSLIPHGQLRLSTVGLTDRSATEDELATMVTLIESALEEGAWGLSTGLEYAAEMGATEQEVTTLCQPVSTADALYACHTRYRDAGAALAIEEAIRTAENSGVQLQISHLVPRSGDEEMRRCLEQVDQAHRLGLDVSFDMHTRLFGFTYLYSALPPWAQADGPERLLEYLRDPAARTKMKEFQSILSAGNDWSRIILLDNPDFPEFSRRDFESIASERGQDPLDSIYDLLLESRGPMSGLMTLIKCHNEDQQVEAFQHDLCMPASDATTLAPDGPLADTIFHGAYTWASYFYDFVVNRRKLMTPTEAVHRLSGMPAKRLGIRDRGFLCSGAYADIVVFNSDRFRDQGTVYEPNRLATGISHVVVNGIPTLLDGALTGRRSGRVLRR